MPEFETVAIIGAGVAGLACARDLRAAGVDVVVYEKSRGPGGRTATRREGTLRFDHGAQHLHPGALDGTPAETTVAAWRPRRSGDLVAAGALGEVPVPTMSAAARALAGGLTVTARTLVEPLTARADGGPLLTTAAGPLPHADRVVVAVPAPQAAVLLARIAPPLAAAALAVPYDPCWTAMAAWDRPLRLPVDVHDAPGDDLAWAAAQGARPGREPGERWVLQASPAWSTAHLEDRPEPVALALLDRFAGTVAAAIDLPQPTLLTAHRWRYAEPSAPLPERCLVAGPLAVAGDWLGGGRVAGAIASGRAAAAALLS